MPLHIRPFAPGDEQAFRELNEIWILRYFEIEPADRVILDNPIAAIIDRGGHLLVAELNGESVGVCALVPMPDETFELVKMAVSERHQGQGIGRMLLAEAIATAKRTAARRIHLETNSVLTAAVQLYESVGFRPVESNSEFRRADVAMELVLE